MGLRHDFGLTYLPPTPTHKVPVSAREAFAGVEDVAHNNEIARHAERVVELISSIPPGKNMWHPDVPKHLRHRGSDLTMSHIYRRLHPDEPSFTILASGGGGTWGYHYEHPRALTNRERARLQSFPDDFVFNGSYHSVRKQIGMAVPPLGAEVVGAALIKTMNSKKYEHEIPSIGVLR